MVPIMHNVKIGKGNLMGKKFNMITILRLDRSEGHHNYWVCKCECGAEFIAIGNNIVRGKTKSCGCMKKAIAPWLKRTHGDCGTRFYYTWASMKSRTTSKSNERYGDYGGRGIRLHEKWLDYEGFKSDMYASYLKHVEGLGELETTIERKDVDGDYCPDNCTWATREEQGKNTRRTIRLVFQGKPYTIKELAQKINMNPYTFKDRIVRGWGVERAVSTPVNYRFLNVASH